MNTQDAASVTPETTLGGWAAIIVPVLAALFVGVGKLVSVYMASKKEIVDAANFKSLGEAKQELAILQIKYDSLLERYNEIREEERARRSTK